MAKVVLQADVARDFAGGQVEHEILADNIRQVIKQLEAAFPGIAQRLNERTAVAVDGEIFQDPFLQAVQPHSEVYFLPMIDGG
ncbi:MAG: molybdopterin converting factor small subunit [Gammaproteobacteria bacterium]|jgi:molybdopterin converting factor small subunit